LGRVELYDDLPGGSAIAGEHLNSLNPDDDAVRAFGFVEIDFSEAEFPDHSILVHQLLNRFPPM
jgi:hypothetical protein